jgi:hypothetical protein
VDASRAPFTVCVRITYNGLAREGGGAGGKRERRVSCHGVQIRIQVSF